jgi:hypothetical protein
MTKLHPNNGHQIATGPFSPRRRVTEPPERRSIDRTSESAPPPNTSVQRNWEMLAILSFVVFSFAAFFFCGFILWARCDGG